MDTFADRARHLLAHYKLNENSFSKKIGKSYTGVVKVVRGESKPNLDMIESILAAFPEVNPSWLVAGEGKMLRDSKEMEVPAAETLQEYVLRLVDNFARLTNQLEKKDEQIENLHEMLKMALGKFEPDTIQPKLLPLLGYGNVA